MSYILNWTKGGVHCKFAGTVTQEDHAKAVEEIARSEMFDALGFVIADYEGVNTIENNGEMINMGIISRLSAYNMNAKTKVCVVTIDKSLRIINLMQMDVGKFKNDAKIFANIADAHVWLGANNS